MALCNLLRMGPTSGERAGFAHDHRVSHRTYALGMSPLSRFAVMPYLIDPQQENGKYYLNHQQSHWDFNSALQSFPTYYFQTAPTPMPMGLPSNQNLIDTDLTNQDKVTWWTWVNHNEHYAAQVSMPQPTELVFW